MVKVISLSNEAYEKLSGIKNGKSFSEVVVELVDKGDRKKDIMKFAGVFAGDKEWTDTMEDVIKDRENFKLRGVNFDVLH